MRLLIAEDDALLRRSLVAVFEKNNYSVDAVGDGADALIYAETGNYDGIILDVMMPRMDGISVVGALRKKGIGAPVLMLTAKAEIEDRVNGLESGADDYLAKPFAVAELTARVKAMLRRKDVYLPDELRFGDVALNRNVYSLTAEGGSAKLTGKEFQLFEMLAESAGSIIPTGRLFERIWGWDSEVDPSIIWTLVSNLRKKLAGIGAKTSICAAKGVGYYLEA